MKLEFTNIEELLEYAKQVEKERRKAHPCNLLRYVAIDHEDFKKINGEYPFTEEQAEITQKYWGKDKYGLSQVYLEEVDIGSDGKTINNRVSTEDVHTLLRLLSLHVFGYKKNHDVAGVLFADIQEVYVKFKELFLDSYKNRLEKIGGNHE